MDQASQGQSEATGPGHLGKRFGGILPPSEAYRAWDGCAVHRVLGYGNPGPSEASGWSYCEANGDDQRFPGGDSSNGPADRPSEIQTGWVGEGETQDRSPLFWIALITGIGIWIGLAMMWGFGK